MLVKSGTRGNLSVSHALTCALGLGLALGIYAVCLYVSQLPRFLHLQMNADGLQLISYIWDLRHHAFAWDGIQWPRAPHWFPDLSVQAVASLLTPSDAWAIFAYNIAQFSGFILIAGYIAFLLSESSLLASVSVSAAVISLAVLADAMLPGATGLPLKYFLPVNHFGPFVASLLGSVLAFRLVKNWSLATAVTLLIVSVLSILSDKLLLISFAIPVGLAAVGAAYKSEHSIPRRVYALIATIVASTAVAEGIDATLNRQGDIPVELMQIFTRAHSFIGETSKFLLAHIAPFAICLLLPLVTFLLYPLVFRSTVATRRKLSGQLPLALSDKARSQEIDVTTFFFWTHACLSIVAVVGLTALILYIDEGSYRYLVPVFSWTLIFTAAAILRVKMARWTVYFISFAAALFLCFALVKQQDLRPGPVTWHFPLADCLTEATERLRLKVGISEYWLSRPLMFESGWSLQVNQAASDGAPYLMETDRYWFTKSFAEPSRRLIYNFVVITTRAGWDKRKGRTPETLIPQSIINRFGYPDHIHTCNGGEEIWVYDDSERFTTTFLRGIAERTESYRASCRIRLWIGARLFALCRTADSHWRVSTLNASQCGGDIGNSGGTLTCALLGKTTPASTEHR